jgi:hypothetical protein
MLAMIKCTTKTTTPTEEFQIEDTGDQYMGTAQGTFAVELCGGATGSDVTGSHVIWSGPDRKSSARKWRHNRKYVLHMPGFSPGFFLAIVVQVPGLPEVTKGQVTPSRVPLGVRMHNWKLPNFRPSGAFWPEVTLWSITPSWPKVTGPLRGSLGWGTCMRDRKCPWGVL